MPQNHLEIIPFEERYAKDFHDINMAWVKQYFEVEEKDRRTLENPVETIIKPGGAIFLARYGSDIIGAVALIKFAGDAYGNAPFELSKMGVTPKAQGKGAGLALCQAAIKEARDRNASHVFLETNSALKPAIALYEKMGFKHYERGASPYARADVAMILMLD